jgi:hypothetical protein
MLILLRQGGVPEMDTVLSKINRDQAMGRIPVAGDESGEKNLIPMMATPAVVLAVSARAAVQAVRAASRANTRTVR